MISKEDFVSNMLKINQTSDAISKLSNIFDCGDIGSAPMFSWYGSAADLMFAVFNSQYEIKGEENVDRFYEVFWNIAACMTYEEAKESKAWEDFYYEWGNP